MFRLILLVYVACFFSCADNGQKPIEGNLIKDTSLKIITTGIPDLEAIIQMNFFAKRYGFKYFPIGCVVTKSKIDSIYKVNDSAYRVLETKLGKKWKMNFYSQLDTANQLRHQADSIINSRSINNEESYFYYLVIPDSVQNQFRIKAYSRHSINGKSELIVHYMMKIILGQEVTADISKTFEKL